MFCIYSKVDNMYGILDTDDNVVEYYSIDKIKELLNQGVKIYGATLFNSKVYIKPVVFNDSAIELAKRLLVDSIWKSANLEGLGTTFPKTEAILENISVKTNKEEMLFILNMKSAWQFLLDNISYSNNLLFIRQLNQLVGEGLFINNGIVRTSIVQIGGTSWIPDIPIEDLIINSLNEINSISDIELRALKMFCYLSRTQIFIDGNKRIAQLMANKVLIENNIGIFQIPIDFLEQFKELLINFYETNNDKQIINFMKKHCIVKIKY